MVPRILIIGGVAAGPAAAARLKRLRPDSDVTLFEQGEHISYGTCSMPYFLGGDPERAEDLIHFTPEQFSKEKGCSVRIRHRVERVIPVRQRILVRNLDADEVEELRYDTLLFATGARSREVSHPPAENIFTLRTLSDAKRIHHWMTNSSPQRILIVGGGFVGMELAEAMSRRALDVTVIHRDDLPVNQAEPEIRAIVLDELRRKGVRFVGGATPVRWDVTNSRVGSVETTTGRMETDMVLLATGFVPNSELARDARIRCGSRGGIVVDAKMRTNVEHIYAAGACAEVRHLVSQKHVFHPLAQTANLMGRIAAANMAGESEELDGILGTSAVKIFDLQVASVGLTHRDALNHGIDAASSTVSSRSRGRDDRDSKPLFAKLVYHRRTRRLLGAHLVGEEGAALRVNTMATAVAKQMTVEELARIDMMYTPPFAPLWDPLTIAARQAK